MEILNTIHISKSPFYKGLISDYTLNKEQLKGLVRDFPSPIGLISYAKEKKFPLQKRQLLQTVLEEQYDRCEIKKPENLSQLTDENAFTITTGHQLNLFGGPLYTLLKIASTIKLCRDLNRESEKHFIPVFWMATEDHDWEEINRAVVFGNEIKSSYEGKGPVGKISVSEIQDAVKKLMEVLGDRFDPDLRNLIQESYATGNLAEATFKFYSKLFQDTELLILDADHPQLKKSFSAYFEKDIFENTYNLEVQRSSTELAGIYKSQAHPREINTFYIQKAYRERIISKSGLFLTADEKFQWSESELKTELEKHPENFSPNVILRPLYQEHILPNIAYIGGGGELAYWMQLKSGFEKMHIDFPFLILRDTGFFIRKNSWKKWEQMGLGFEDLFNNRHELLKEVALKNSEFQEEFSLPENWENWVGIQKSDLEKIDPSLVQSFDAELSKWEKSIEKLKGKKIAAIKRRQENTLNQIENILEKCFPGDGLNERKDSFLDYYNPVFISDLIELSNPLDYKLKSFLI